MGHARFIRVKHNGWCNCVSENFNARATALNQQFIQTVKAKLKTQGVDVVMNELRYSSQVEDQIAAKTIETLGASQDALAAEICELTRQDVESLTGK